MPNMRNMQAQYSPVQSSTGHYGPVQLCTAQYSHVAAPYIPVQPIILVNVVSPKPHFPFQKPHSLLCLVFLSLLFFALFPTMCEGLSLNRRSIGWWCRSVGLLEKGNRTTWAISIFTAALLGETVVVLCVGCPGSHPLYCLLLQAIASQQWSKKHQRQLFGWSCLCYIAMEQEK